MRGFPTLSRRRPHPNAPTQRDGTRRRIGNSWSCVRGLGPPACRLISGGGGSGASSRRWRASRPTPSLVRVRPGRAGQQDLPSRGPERDLEVHRRQVRHRERHMSPHEVLQGLLSFRQHVGWLLTPREARNRKHVEAAVRLRKRHRIVQVGRRPVFELDGHQHLPEQTRRTRHASLVTDSTQAARAGPSLPPRAPPGQCRR